METKLNENEMNSRKVSAVAFDTDGLTMGVGTSSAHCLTFDLRSSRPTFVKEHQYGLPITGVKFHQVLFFFFSHQTCDGTAVV